MENYRTFLGVPVKVDTGFLHGREQLMHRLKEERISWVDPALYHVTLRFLGDTSNAVVQEISRLLGQLPEVPAVSRIGIYGPGSFGPTNRPRVVWTGFRQEELFLTLHREVNMLLASLGIPEQDQSFRPHLTLGRIRSLGDPERFCSALEEVKDHFRGQVTASRLVYFRSILGEKGPRYIPLQTVEFGS
jgi:2'-5' RNA ligase